MDWIANKIQALGGVTGDGVNPTKVSSPEDFESKYGITLENDFKDFIKEVGFNGFVEWVCTSTIEQIPAYIDKICDYHTIYGFGEGKRSIDYLMDLTDQLIDSSKYIPFADGASGDYLCVSILPESKGKIFYMHHESDEEDDLFLVANSIRELLDNSYVLRE